MHHSPVEELMVAQLAKIFSVFSGAESSLLRSEQLEI
jgi:hypothetical protein